MYFVTDIRNIEICIFNIMKIYPYKPCQCCINTTNIGTLSAWVKCVRMSSISFYHSDCRNTRNIQEIEQTHFHYRHDFIAVVYQRRCTKACLVNRKDVDNDNFINITLSTTTYCC